MLIVEMKRLTKREWAIYGMSDESWHVYLLLCKDGTLYCGATNNLERRLGQHNEGRASKYTRARLPVELIAHGIPMEKGAALSLEARIKKLPKSDKISALMDYGENG